MSADQRASQGGTDGQSEVRALLAEASSEDSDLEPETQKPSESLPPPLFDPTSQSTVSSTVSGPLIPPATEPASGKPPTNEKAGIINKNTLCILLLSHSLVFIFGLFIGGRALLNRRIFS